MLQFILRLYIFFAESIMNESMMTSSKDHQRKGIYTFENIYRGIGMANSFNFLAYTNVFSISTISLLLGCKAYCRIFIP